MNRPSRSFLFVPGDSERKIEKAAESNADALVLDLEDSVAPARKALARDLVSERLRVGFRLGLSIWVRINPLATPEALQDLAAIVGGAPAGVLLPKAEGPGEVERLGHHLDALEVREGLRRGSVSIMPVATETAHAPFSLGDYRTARLPRLYGLTWGAEDLSAALGAATNRADDGELALTYRMVRSLTLLASKAAGVEAVDAIHPDYRDSEGLAKDCATSRREGFTGRLAIHPDQIDIINAAFSPNEADIQRAEQIVAAFASAPDAGVVGLDGRMLDRPHLEQALKLLALRDAFLT